MAAGRPWFRWQAWLAAGFALSLSALALAAVRGKSGAGEVRRLQGVEYVNAATFGGRFGLKVTWLEAGKRLRLQSAYTNILFEVDRRDIAFNGYRLFLGEPVLAADRALWISHTDARLLLTPLLRSASAEVAAPLVKRICLDPGHGGQDSGTRHRALGLDEKRFTLDVAQRVKRLLEDHGYEVVMTRTDDRFVDLSERAERANRAKADLFVSIHFNAVDGGPAVNGTETFILTRQGQRSTSATKRAESDQIALAGNRMDPWNAVLGYHLHRHLLTQLATFDRGLKFARFKVLTLVNCPGVLVEAGYLSNDAEAKKIAQPAYRAEIALAIVNGINAYAAQVAAARK